jgi:hypothetical protein
MGMNVTLVNPEGRSLLFVCPAYQRYDLSQITFRQMAYMRERLRGRGLETDILVVANDDNLDIAADHGLLTMIYENLLGQKLNEGYAYAAREGYEYVCALGSDSWMDPDRLAWLPAPEAILCTRNLALVDRDGDLQRLLRIGYDGGAGSRIIPLHWLKPYDYRPLHPTQMSGCDTETLMAICRRVERPPAVVYTDLHPYEIVSFQSAQQVTRDAFWEPHVVDRERALAGLADHYPDRLVDEIRDHYAALAAA